MADLNEQLRRRRELRDREYHRQDMDYHEARRRDLDAQIKANEAKLAKVESDLATVMARLTRVEEVLDLREMFAVEAVPCSVDRPGAYSCPGCCVCQRPT
jgi:uncharacterized protein YPO0396